MTRSRGFTLIEVIIALMILGGAFVALLNAFSGSLRLARAAQEHETAMLLARSKLDELAVDTELDVEDTREEEIYGGVRYSYKIEVRPVNVLEPALVEKIKLPRELQEIKINVYWGPKGRERNYQLVDYKLTQPKPEKKL